MPTIDINCDLGERPAPEGVEADIRLMELVTSVNIACGAHAGDADTMRAIVTAAHRLKRGIGAHPGYPDRANFGRVSLNLTPREIETSITEQLHALLAIAQPLGATITHVKPHGALYHDAMHRPEVSLAISRAVRAAWAQAATTPQSKSPTLPILVALAGSPVAARWRGEGLRIAAEAFADRRYAADGTLAPRSQPGAVITDPAEAARQAIDIVVHRCVSAGGGGDVGGGSSLITIRADTLCIHSDSPGAETTASHVRGALLAASCAIKPMHSAFLE